MRTILRLFIRVLGCFFKGTKILTSGADQLKSDDKLISAPAADD
jgi:hypothetical protein